MIPKMFIESKNNINIKSIYQGKAGAICKTQLFIFEFFEDFFGRFFNIFINAEYGNVTTTYLIHKFD